METAHKAFRKNLNHLLEVNEKSQVDLSNYLNVSKSTVSMWASGKSYPEVVNLEGIARFFNVSIFELICERESDEEELLRYFRTLSKYGRKEAVKRMYELTQLYWYDKEKDGIVNSL